VSNLCVFNPLFKNTDFSKEENYKTIIKSYFMHLWQLDNVILLLGAGASKYLGGPLMKDLSESILPPLIEKGYKEFGNSDFITIWNDFWGMEQTYISDKNNINKYGKEYISKINIETKLSELKMLSYSFSVLKKNIQMDFVNYCIEKIKTEIIKNTSNFVPNIKSDPFKFAQFGEAVT